jgi:hypothetical protein
MLFGEDGRVLSGAKRRTPFREGDAMLPSRGDDRALFDASRSYHPKLRSCRHELVEQLGDHFHSLLMSVLIGPRAQVRDPADCFFG